MPEADPQQPVRVVLHQFGGDLPQQPHLRVALIARVPRAGAQHHRPLVRPDRLAQPRLVERRTETSRPEARSRWASIAVNVSSPSTTSA
ncbi:hypothetical protein SCALM49S_06658 [Streptomyces californicus]